MEEEIQIRLCLWCKENELPAGRDKYCSQLCYREALAKKNRDDSAAKGKGPEVFPVWRCPNSHLIQLDFNPVKEKIRWKQYQCPTCGAKNIE